MITIATAVRPDPGIHSDRPGHRRYVAAPHALRWRTASRPDPVRRRLRRLAYYLRGAVVLGVLALIIILVMADF